MREEIEKEAELMHTALLCARDYIRLLRENEGVPCSAEDIKIKIVLAKRWNAAARRAGVDP